MEMQVDAKLIRWERNKRAWSQAHLAEVAGIGLRTVQRIEATGFASYESARSLAAVLEVPVSMILAGRLGEARMVRPTASRRRLLAAATACIAALSSILIVRSVVAQQVMLEVGISLNDEERGTGRLVTGQGEDAEIRIDDLLRIIISPTIQGDGSILLAASIFDYENGEARLISSPTVATADQVVAEIRLGSEAGDVYRFRITPTVR